MDYTLTLEQRHFIQHTVSLALYVKYKNEYCLDFKRICSERKYSKEDKILLNQMREEYMKTESPIVPK